MKTIIHIGQHKTGTSSIQKFLQDNRENYAENGFYVPSKIAGYTCPSHFILNVYSLAEDRLSAKKEELIAKKGKRYLSKLEVELRNDIKQIYKEALFKKSTNVIWSNEGLYLLNSVEEYQRLINLFSDYSTEIEVVCCFRDVESYKESYIQQLKKAKVEISNNPNSYCYLESDSWLFDYKRKKELLSSVFDKCTYFSYEPTDNVKRFNEAIGFMANNTIAYRINVTDRPKKNFLQRIKNLFISIC